MSKQHDENQDVRILSRNRIYVNQGQKLIKAPKDTPIGIRAWGRIDYLCHYCAYHFIWDNSAIVDRSNYEDSDKKKDLRSIKKESKHIKNRTMNS